MKNSLSVNTSLIGKSGIYFLMSRGKIVYIGQTKHNLYGRLDCHRFNKEFDSVLFQEQRANNLNDVEAYYIWTYAPLYNNKLPLNKRFKNVRLLRKNIDKYNKLLASISSDQKKEISIKTKTFGIVTYYDRSSWKNVRNFLSKKFALDIKKANKSLSLGAA